MQRRKGTHTVIMVTQRPSFIALADRVIDLDDPSTVHADPEELVSPVDILPPRDRSDPASGIGGGRVTVARADD